MITIKIGISQKNGNNGKNILKIELLDMWHTSRLFSNTTHFNHLYQQSFKANNVCLLSLN